MSAFVVENATIGIILRGLLEMAPEVWEAIPGKTMREKGDALFQMNADAVNQRYNEEDPAPKYNPMVLSVSYMEEKGALEYSPGQWYTSLRSFLYQCAELDLDTLTAPLYEEIGRLKMELDWLKKNPALTLEEKRQSVDPWHPHINVRRQCELLDLSRSSYYRESSPGTESPENLLLMRLIDAQHLETPFYGSRPPYSRMALPAGI